jgi:LPXTG-motif cell wall-anchored protein
MPSVDRLARPRHALLALGVGLAPGLAHAVDDPLGGKALYEDTRAVSGVTTVTMSCPACHGDIQTHRALIATRTGLVGGSYADISVDTALTRFQAAMQAQSGMRQFLALSTAQQRDLAAYLADTPKTTPDSETTLGFAAPGVNTSSAARTVTLHHAVATNETLTIVGVQASGTEAGNFTVTPQCNGIVLAPGTGAASSCSVSVSYTPRNANVSTPDLVFSLRQGTTDFDRVLFLSGTIAATPPPDTGGASGGGALGLGGLAALGAAVLALARRRR